MKAKKVEWQYVQIGPQTQGEYEAGIECQMVSFCSACKSVHHWFNWERWIKTDKRKGKILNLVNWYQGHSYPAGFNFERHTKNNSCPNILLSFAHSDPTLTVKFNIRFYPPWMCFIHWHQEKSQEWEWFKISTDVLSGSFFRWKSVFS